MFKSRWDHDSDDASSLTGWVGLRSFSVDELGDREVDEVVHGKGSWSCERVFCEVVFGEGLRLGEVLVRLLWRDRGTYTSPLVLMG